ncbi:Vacuolar fusion protein MON1-like protein A [Armadillidium nasatum]|uniref:Vacuolar fusion protein MON1 homolog n=1 Tax=Armadillidium nasatum TaxID=96803 RepID=A0A5N5T0V4_9CRUS|nr:Vacuolar fusion protein MON1-like protein A [Armadillidium nasatum]
MNNASNPQEEIYGTENSEALGDDELSSKTFDNDTQGAKREVIFANSDSVEECNEDLNESFSSDNEEESNENTSKDDKTSSGSHASNLPINETFDSDLESSVNLSSLNVDEEEAEEPTSDEDYLYNPEWINREKHIFILSEAGKPIYSRYGKEDRLALVSFVADGDDVIRCINAGGHKFVFLIRTPLILIAVARTSESVPQILLQLTYIHSQVLSVLPSFFIDSDI